MATIEKVAGGYRARVRKKGQDVSRTFARKAQAQAWAADIERELAEGVQAGKTLADAIERYRDEVTPTKRGARWEHVRLTKFLRDLDFADEMLTGITVPTIAQWRDDRLKEVQGSSVRRELTLLSSVFEQARREWQWIKTNPCRDVRKPQSNPHRTRRVSDDEIERVLIALGYDSDAPAESKSAQTAVAFLFALETAMRQGEILVMQRDHVDFDRRVALLPKTKNGHARTVPLTQRALSLLRQLPEQGAEFFQLSSSSCDALFRKYVRRAGVQDLHFHDSRREATSRLAKQVDVLTLAKITGHRNISELLTYYQTDMADVARELQTTTQPEREDTGDRQHTETGSQGGPSSGR